MSFTRYQYLRATGETTCESVSNADFLSYIGMSDLAALTTSEVEQLGDIGTTTISAAQWGYLGALDQDLGAASTPEFASITLPAGASILGSNVTIVTSPGDKLAFYGGTPVVQQGPIPIAETSFDIASGNRTADKQVIIDDFNYIIAPSVVEALNYVGRKINNLFLLFERYNLTAS